MKNILIIHKPYDSNLSIGIRHNSIIKFISNNYLNVKDLSYHNTNRLNKKDFFSKPFSSTTIKYLFYRFFYPPASTDLNLNKFKKIIKTHLKNNKTDVVIILINPYYLLRLTEYIKKHDPNIKVVVDMSDPYSQGVRFVNISKLSKYLMKRFEKKVFNSVDSLIVLDGITKKYYKNLVNDIFLIDQGIDIQNINKIKTTSVRTINDKVVNMTYGGKFYKNVREPFELYQAIVESDLQIKFTVYSQLNNSEYFPPESKKIDYEKAIIQNELFTKYIETDIIVFIDNFIGFQVPGKIIETLAFNKPILFIYQNEQSPTLKYIENQPGVFLVKNNSKLIIKTINDIVNQSDRVYVRDVSKYYWSNLLYKLKEIIDG